MDRLRLRFQGVSEIVGSEHLGILCLTDMECEHQLTIVCDKEMAVQIELRVKQEPITCIMLPEVLAQYLKSRGTGNELEVLICDLVDGQYKTLLCDRETQDVYPIRATDGVLFSLVADIPIYIDARLMARQAVRYAARSRGVSIPVNTLSRELLDKALQKAIDEENYELASQLRDEKLRRAEQHSGD